MLKLRSILFVLMSVVLLTGSIAARAQGSIVKTASPRAVIRGGASQNTDINETESPFNMVKYSAAPFDTSRKLYALIDLAGEKPNTNGPLWILYNTAANSQRQDVQVWSLSQPYPGFNSQITWNTAQANDTNSGGGLLTSGPLTAIPYQRFLSATAGNVVDQTHQLNGPWGQMIVDGKILLVLSSVTNVADNGFRMADGTLRIAFDPITSGSPPTLGPLPDLAVFQDQSSVTNSFVVGDLEDGPNRLDPTATSSNPTIIDPANIVFGGTSASRSLHLIAGSTPGTATIVVSISDSAGHLATRSFLVTVKQYNQSPVITAAGLTNTIPTLFTPLNTVVTVALGVNDAETPRNNLTVTAEVAPYSTDLLQSAVLSGVGPNTNLSLRITPVTGADGVGVVQISVNDPAGNTNTLRFCVMVLPSPKIVFSDHFDYNASNSKLTDDAPGFWIRRNASAQSVFLRSATDPVLNEKVAWLRPNAGAEDLAAPLAGGPYPPQSGAVLYAKFTAHFANATGLNVITNGDSPFFRLSQGPTANTDFVGNLGLSTNGVTDGATEFRLLLSNGTANYTPWTASFPQPSAASTTKHLILRYDVAQAQATLWVDGVLETALSLSATDAQSPVPVGYVGLFQDRGSGDIYVDDLKVLLEIRPRITSLSQPGNGTVQLVFAASAADLAPDFTLQHAATASGPYADAPAALVAEGGGSFKASFSAPAAQGFYRVRRQPVNLSF